MHKQQVVEMLNELLLAEYEQRDLYETYSYYLYGPVSSSIQEHLKDHIKDEQEHIETLQRYLSHLGADPILHRKQVFQVPKVVTLRKILEADLELELQAVNNYSHAIAQLEDNVKYTSLRVSLENILEQEQEHVHDLTRWLREDLCDSCKSNTSHNQ